MINTLPASKTKRKRNNFINNREFYEALINYKISCEKAKKEGNPKPQIPAYIGKCLYDISDHLSQRPNFSNYIFREDMVMDGAENCVEYVSSFDPDRSKNPFSYFTQVCWYAFLRRIKKEKRQIEICDKLIEKSGFEEFFTSDEGGSSSDYNSIKDYVNFRQRRQ